MPKQIAYEHDVIDSWSADARHGGTFGRQLFDTLARNALGGYDQ
jgi:hypothetical protein